MRERPGPALDRGRCSRSISRRRRKKARAVEARRSRRARPCSRRRAPTAAVEAPSPARRRPPDRRLGRKVHRAGRAQRSPHRRPPAPRPRRHPISTLATRARRPACREKQTLSRTTERAPTGEPPLASGWVVSAPGVRRRGGLARGPRTHAPRSRAPPVDAPPLGGQRSPRRCCPRPRSSRATPRHHRADPTPPIAAPHRRRPRRGAARIARSCSLDSRPPVERRAYTRTCPT